MNDLNDRQLEMAKILGISFIVNIASVTVGFIAIERFGSEKGLALMILLVIFVPALTVMHYRKRFSG